MISAFTGGLLSHELVVSPAPAIVGRNIVWPEPIPSKLSLDEKYERIMSIACEVNEPSELRELLSRKAHPIAYDGFEPSGRMHVAQGLLKAINVNKLTSSGCIFYFWIADWFALLNNKMDGDLNKIRVVGEYFIEVWKAAGMDMRNVRFLWASDDINGDSNNYWLRVMDVARSQSISRVKRCGQIMGRQDGDAQPCAQIMYPCMQCADIFHLKVDICQLGLDQRKVNMLARDYCTDAKIKHKPIIVSHGMITSLDGEDKASKSKPDSAIFMEDSPEDIRRKIKKAVCPPGETEGNPVIEHITRLVFPILKRFHIPRKPDNGGDITFETEKEFLEAYKSQSLHPGDVKPALATALNEMIDPVRQHFEKDLNAKRILELVKKYRPTR